jgi:hypothetical protein
LVSNACRVLTTGRWDRKNSEILRHLINYDHIIKRYSVVLWLLFPFNLYTRKFHLVTKRPITFEQNTKKGEYYKTRYSLCAWMDEFLFKKFFDVSFSDNNIEKSIWFSHDLRFWKEKKFQRQYVPVFFQECFLRAHLEFSCAYTLFSLSCILALHLK